MKDKPSFSVEDTSTRLRATPYSGSLPQIVLYLGEDQRVFRCDKSLAGDTFEALPDISRTSTHDFLHGNIECSHKCELHRQLRECTSRLENESIIELETYDRAIGRLLRLRFLKSVSLERGQDISILHVIDITAGREVTHSLLNTNKQLGALFREKENALTVSEEKNSENRERLRDMDRLLKTLSTRLIMAQEQERNRISSDLHDGVGQHLSLARYCLDQAREEAANISAPRPFSDTLDRTMSHLDSSIQEVRRITRNLKPSMLEEFGVVATLELLVHEFVSAHSEISAKTNIQSSDSEMPADRSVAVMRILQEATNNISKHAGATQVIFDIKIEKDTISMRISDNGKGFELNNAEPPDSSRPRYGINNMQDRARSSGGRLQISSKPGAGTTIEVIWDGA